MPDGAAAWADAMDALALLAVDPSGLGGITLRAQAGPVRAAWLAMLPAVFPTIRRMPATIGDEALLGGLDLAATLHAGRPVATNGLLASARDGLLLALMAERLPSATAARLTMAMDESASAFGASVSGASVSGASVSGASFSVVALDEGIEPDERPAPALLDRLAFRIDLATVSHRDITAFTPDPAGIAAARAALDGVQVEPEMMEALCSAALALGVESARGTLLALRTARAAAALDGRNHVTAEDAALAARLVLAPRATRLPTAEPEQQEQPDPTPPDGQPGDGDPSEPDSADAGQPAAASDILLQAARAAIPTGLLAQLRSQDFRGKPAAAGREGARQKGVQRGRPVGVRAAPPAPGLRLNLIETLRAAAPWQPLRRAAGGRIVLRRDDFRVTRTEQRARTTTIFLVDASGSSALNRLAEAKGAVELLLADCYRRRDQVAVVAFRGRAALVLLPPTRSLVRAKRSLAGLPGGGGTPLAAGIDAGFLLAETVRRSGATPTIVLLTDGRANVSRAGAGDRAAASSDAAAAGRRVRASGFACLLLDIGPRPAPDTQRLAAAMGALYVPLPYADAAAVSGAVRAARTSRIRP